MYTLDATDSFAIEQPSGAYVYDIVPVAGGLVSISSDDTLRLFDPSNLHRGPVYTVPKVNSEITCLEALDHQGSIVCTAGRDGKVTIVDLRQQLRVAQIGTGKTYVLSFFQYFFPPGNLKHEPHGPGIISCFPRPSLLLALSV